MRKLNDNIDMDATSNTVEGANPMPTIEIDKSRQPTVRGIRLSYRETSQPDTGTPSNELSGMKRRIVPNSASLKPKFPLIVGIREVQDAKQNPESRKNRLRKALDLFLTSIADNFRCEYQSCRLNF